MLLMRHVASRLVPALGRLANREEGQGLVEYTLIIALVSIASIVALGAMSGALNTVWGTITSALSAA